MSDSTSATSGQEPGAQPQAGTIHPESTSQAQAAAGTPDQPTTTVDVAVLQRELAEARREAAKHRTDLRKVTDAQLSESERLQRRVTELEAEREAIATRDRERAIRLAALEAAARLGFRDPDLAVRLVDPASVETKDDGTPRNVERLLAEVLARSPYLGRPGASADFGGGQRGTGPSGTDMNSLIRRAAGRT
jgi:hypothetical protein